MQDFHLNHSIEECGDSSADAKLTKTAEHLPSITLHYTNENVTAERNRVLMPGSKINSEVSENRSLKGVERILSGLSLLCETLQSEKELKLQGEEFWPLPPGWFKITNEGVGMNIYYNEILNITSTLNPSEPMRRTYMNERRTFIPMSLDTINEISAKALPYPWKKYENSLGVPYYVNHEDMVTTWYDPRLPIPATKDQVDRWLTWVRANKQTTLRKFGLHQSAFSLKSDLSKTKEPPARLGLTDVHSTGITKKSRKVTPFKLSKCKKTIFQSSVEEWIEKQQNMGANLPTAVTNAKKPRGRPKKADFLNQISLKRIPSSEGTISEPENGLDEYREGKRRKTTSSCEETSVEDQIPPDPTSKSILDLNSKSILFEEETKLRDNFDNESRSIEANRISPDGSIEFKESFSPSLYRQDYPYATPNSVCSYDVFEPPHHIAGFSHSPDREYHPDTERCRRSAGNPMSGENPGVHWESMMAINFDRRRTSSFEPFHNYYQNQFPTDQNHTYQDIQNNCFNVFGESYLNRSSKQIPVVLDKRQ